MNLLNTLTLAADEEQLRLHPLPEHAAASQDEHLRRHYALLLGAVLTAQPAVSEPQTRLLRLLLDALKLGDIRGELFEQARAPEPAPLLEAARLIRETGFAHHLMVDTLVLLRLDAPLGDEAARLAGELAAFLGLDESALATRAGDASEILGLDANENGSVNSGADKDAGGDDDEDDFSAAKHPLSLADLWPSRLRQPLTADALRSGLQSGLWLLDANLDVDFPWQANDAILVFRNSATLNIFAKKGVIKMSGCRLVDAAFDIHGACNIVLERCNWQGDYDPVAKRTTLNSIGQALTVTDSQFSTRNARAIAVQNNDLNLTGSRFTRCGHAELDGGAVWHSDHNRTIENCRFDRSLASRGGALWVNELYGVNKCEFVSCESRGLRDKNAGDIAIYALKNTASPVLTGCVFRHASINVGNSLAGRGRKIAVDCQFISSNLYYEKNDFHAFADDCTFIKGSFHEKRL